MSNYDVKTLDYTNGPRDQTVVQWNIKTSQQCSASFFETQKHQILMRFGALFI